MSDEHVLDSIAAYVLGSLSEFEAAQVRSHLADCEACQEELRALESVLVDLAESVPQHDPPKLLRARLLEGISLPVTTPLVSESLPGQSFWQMLFGRHVPALVGLGLILVLALSSFLLWQQVNTLKTKVTDTAMIVEPLYPVSSPASTGLVVMDPHGEYGTVIVNELVPSADGEQYQVWLSRGDQVDSGGVFTIRKNGYGAQVIYAPEPLLYYERVWITVEPEGGSEAPTGVVILETHP